MDQSLKMGRVDAIDALRGFAVGLADSLGVAWSLVVGLCVMFAQIWFSRFWLARHKQGPLERIWHRLTWVGRNSTK